MNFAPTTKNKECGHAQSVAAHAAYHIVLAAFVLAQSVQAVVVQRDWIWISVPLVLITAHLMHGLTVAFHEAVHGLLWRNRFLNDLDGTNIGIFSLTSLSLFRCVHGAHHAHFTTERDDELWPFVRTRAPRWARRLAAFLELTTSLAYSQFLLLRAFLRPGSAIKNPKVRRRIWMELALMVVVWTGILLAVSHWQVWKYFLWMYLAPAFLAANFHTWRKFIEHMGLTGSTVKSATRSVVDRGWLGRLISFTLLNEPYHGIHHLRPSLRQGDVPQNVAMLDPAASGDLPPFPSYWLALQDMLRSLGDPRVGAQWRGIVTSGKQFDAEQQARSTDPGHPANVGRSASEPSMKV